MAPIIPRDSVPPLEVKNSTCFESFNSIPLLRDEEDGSDESDVDEGVDSGDDSDDEDQLDHGVVRNQLDIFMLRIKLKSSEEYKQLHSGVTFFPKPDPIVYLKKALRYGGTPSAESFCMVDIHIWAPHITYRGFNPVCPKCRRMLSPKCWASNPRGRRIIGLSESSFLISFRYKCNDCPKNGGKTISFHASSVEMRELMPRYIQISFPFVLTRKKAISREVYARFLTCQVADLILALTDGRGPSVPTATIAELHSKAYNLKLNQYYSWCVGYCDSMELIHGRIYPELFPVYDDKLTYNGCRISGINELLI
jgi:hypothetical protein